MVDTSAIDAFLCKTLRTIREGGIAAWPGAEPAGDWNLHEALSVIWSRIEFHGIPGLLHQQADLLAGWPARLLERIAEEARLLGLWEATHAQALGKLIEALETAGVETVLMKGTALAYSIYDEPAVRRRGDSDLLIHPGDRRRAREVLTQCGWYRSEDPHGLICQEGWQCDAAHFTHALDLHWEPSDRPVVQRVLSRQDLFDFKHPLPRLTENACRTDHALTIMHETLNQKWHFVHGYWAEEGKVSGSRRLIWSVDFDLLARKMERDDWARLVALSDERGIGRLVAEALRGATDDLDTQVPRSVMKALESSPVAPELSAYLSSRDSLGEFWIDLKTARSWRRRIRMLLQRGFPPRSHLIEKYPRQSGWPTALLQGRLLIETAGRVLRRVTTS